MFNRSRIIRQRATIVAVYGTALMAGLSVVSFPASAAALKAAHGFSDAAYGAIFLPQLALTLLGSVASAVLAPRLGLLFLLRAALLAFAVGETALFATAHADAAAYPLVLLGTGAVGLGFGLAAAPLNGWPGLLFPSHPDPALVALHTVMGAGFALGPVVVGALLARGTWSSAPLSACVALASLLALSVISEPATVVATVRTGRGPTRLLPFLLIALLYAFAEGTFANWATVFLQEERGLAAAPATLALSTFWAALVVGRLLVSWLLVSISPLRIWLALPPLIAVAFLLLPSAQGTTSALSLFGFAGLACGAFFPLTVARAVASAPRDSASISAWMTAALMVGAGLASFAIGPLRALLPIGKIYLLSCAYPLCAGLLALRVAASERAAHTPATQPLDSNPG